jgi:hypothetical protein
MPAIKTISLGAALAVGTTAGVLALASAGDVERAHAPALPPIATDGPPEPTNRAPTQPSARRDERPPKRSARRRAADRKQPTCKEVIAENETLRSAPPEVRDEVVRSIDCRGPAE